MSLAPIREALDRAADGGRILDMWWRDDDAVTSTPALDRLFALARRATVPVAVAAIPTAADRSLAQRIAAQPGANVLVHGLRHASYAPAGQKSAEFGQHRFIDTMAGELRLALARLAALLGPDRLLPVLVPPWNRIDPALVPQLARLGYGGLSTFGPRGAALVHGLAVVNTHVDPVDWRGSRSAVQPAALAAALRRATAYGDEPIGLLTHHLQFDSATWRLTEALLDFLTSHRAIRFVSAANLWAAETLSSNCAPKHAMPTNAAVLAG